MYRLFFCNHREQFTLKQIRVIKTKFLTIHNSLMPGKTHYLVNLNYVFSAGTIITICLSLRFDYKGQKPII